MSATVKLGVVIPAKREEAVIGRVLARLAAHVPEAKVWLVVETADDPTVAATLAAPSRPADLEVVVAPGGPAAALRAGLARAAQAASWVAVVMADEADEVELLPRMLDLAQRHDALVVAGSRLAPGGAYQGGPPLKRRLSIFANRSLHRLGAVPIHDATNAFKLYRGPWLRTVSLKSRHGFEINLELIHRALRSGGRILEVPTRWRDRSGGRSKFRLWRWLGPYLYWYARLLLRR